MKKNLNNTFFLKFVVSLLLLIINIGCAKSNKTVIQIVSSNVSNQSETTNNSDSNTVSLSPQMDSYPLPSLTEKDINNPCVQIFYDRTTITGHERGKLYSLMVANLVGHFPGYTRVISPIELYRKNDLNKCKANFYISSYFGNDIPPQFIADFLSTEKNVVWMGYNFWTLGNDILRSEFGVEFESLKSADTNYLDSTGKPGYFRDVLYKGEIFKKVPQTSEIAKLNIIPPKPNTPPKAEVLASIKNSASNEIIPWAIRSKNKYLITETPLSYIHESDRYLVFADLLFDILNEKPLHSKKSAVIRLEDISVHTNLEDLKVAVDTLKAENVTPHLSLIPVYVASTNTTTAITLADDPAYREYITKIQSSLGANFIWHGVTHQTTGKVNPFSGQSGDDYEFWDYPLHTPLAEDSIDFVLNKLEMGETVFKQLGISSRVWVTPHYLASTLDNVLFSQLFPYTMGRMSYFAFQTYGLRGHRKPEKLWFPSLDNHAKAERATHFYNLVVFQDSTEGVGQFFPYEIQQDVYGQRIIPENLGNLQPKLNEQVTHTRTVAEILADAKRNRVLRDVWASAFIHPYLLHGQSPDSNELKQIVQGLKALGYEFVNLEKQLPQPKSVGENRLIDFEFIRY